MCTLILARFFLMHAHDQGKWQIPDPPRVAADGAQRDDPIDALDLELVLLPGVAFDRSGGRLGHGKGYYGASVRKQMPALVAVLDCLGVCDVVLPACQQLPLTAMHAHALQTPSCAA